MRSISIALAVVVALAGCSPPKVVEMVHPDKPMSTVNLITVRRNGEAMLTVPAGASCGVILAKVVEAAKRQRDLEALEVAQYGHVSPAAIELRHTIDDVALAAGRVCP